MSSLYQLVGERLALQHKLEDMNFDEQTIEDTLEGESTAIQAKIESYGYVIKNLRAPAVPIKEEIKRLQDRLKAFEKQADNVENWLFINMQKVGISKIECPAFTIAIQNNPASVIIEDEALIPRDYFTDPVAPPPAPNKTLIKQAINDGYAVPGASLKTGQRLVIK